MAGTDGVKAAGSVSKGRRGGEKGGEHEQLGCGKARARGREVEERGD